MVGLEAIYTTVATFHECVYMLKQKGAASVTGMVIASGAL
jgi:predicted amidophosphoribosyltransferase